MEGRLVVASGALVITGLVAGCGSTTRSGAGTTLAPASTTLPTTAPPTTAAAPTTQAPTTPAPPTTSGPTLSQQNAIKAGQQYLNLGSGFSQAGLIQQLSSQAGDGYSLADATYAVDHLNVDWNAQAVLSAKAYLKTSAFSCSALVEQLSSSAGDQFTTAQAQYGANATGIC